MHIPEKKWKELWKLKPFVSSDCVVVKGNEILLVKRATHPFKGSWCLPGGMMKIGETIEQTALREVTEEAGAEVKIIKLIGVYSGPHRDPRGTTLSVAFLMEFVKMKGKHDNEIADVKFFPIDKMPKLAFDHEQMVKDALR